MNAVQVLSIIDINCPQWRKLNSYHIYKKLQIPTLPPKSQMSGGTFQLIVVLKNWQYPNITLETEL